MGGFVDITAGNWTPHQNDKMCVWTVCQGHLHKTLELRDLDRKMIETKVDYTALKSLWNLVDFKSMLEFQ